MDMIEHTGGGMAARYFIDGKRVSRATFQAVKRLAHMTPNGLAAFWTRGRQVGDGQIRRVNGCCANVSRDAARMETGESI